LNGISLRIMMTRLMAFRFLLSGDRHFRKKGGDLVAFSPDRLHTKPTGVHGGTKFGVRENQ
jgi:hypothetical protein